MQQAHASQCHNGSRSEGLTHLLTCEGSFRMQQAHVSLCPTRSKIESWPTFLPSQACARHWPLLEDQVTPLKTGAPAGLACGAAFLLLTCAAHCGSVQGRAAHPI